MSAPEDPSGVTVLLERWHDGDKQALDQVVPLVYAELGRLARAQLARAGNATLQPTELINEAYMKLVDSDRIDWAGRAHFFSMAALVMRRVLVDRYRKRQADRRGGGMTRVTLNTFREVDASTAPSETLDLDRLDDALVELERLDSRQARIVILRFFGGLTIEQTASALELSVTTVKREWAAARIWLHRALKPGQG